MLHADSAVISSTDIFNRGVKPRVETMGLGGSALRQCGIFLLSLVLTLALGAAEIPRASGKALGMTKGKPFRTGLVFVDGKYLAPPYTVDRWGVGIRINGQTVIAQAVDWTEFLKAQPNVKVTRTETMPPPPPEPKEEEKKVESGFEPGEEDLFADDPTERPAAPKPPPRVIKPIVTLTYELTGEFVPNDVSKKLTARIKAIRSEIEATLRAGGFVCFGEKYARVTGDSHTALQILEKLPDLQHASETEDAFKTAVREAGMEYLTDLVCADLFRNRVDYRRLQERFLKVQRDREIQKFLEGK